MKVNNGSNVQHTTIGQKMAKPFKKAGAAIKKGIDAVDRYTKPRKETAGDFKKASYFQSCFTGAIEGFYVLGPAGIATGAVSGAVGTAVTNKSNKTALGVLAGVATGAAIGAGTAALIGGPMGVVGGAVAGSILGAMETFRGNPESQTRDGGGNANMISAAFVPGPAKMAGGIGSAVGTRFKSKPAKAIMGGLTAAVLGGTLAAIGFAPVSIPIAIGACAAAGAAGPFVGPRFSQLFRNLANDIGNAVEKGMKKVGLLKEDKEMGKSKNVIGSIPASFIKEGMRGFALSGGDVGKMLLGGVTESIEQAHIFLTQKGPEEEKKADEAKPKTNNPTTLKQEDPSIEKS